MKRGLRRREEDHAEAGAAGSGFRHRFTTLPTQVLESLVVQATLVIGAAVFVWFSGAVDGLIGSIANNTYQIADRQIYRSQADIENVFEPAYGKIPAIKICNSKQDTKPKKAKDLYTLLTLTLNSNNPAATIDISTSRNEAISVLLDPTRNRPNVCITGSGDSVVLSAVNKWFKDDQASVSILYRGVLEDIEIAGFMRRSDSYIHHIILALYVLFSIIIVLLLAILLNNRRVIKNATVAVALADQVTRNTSEILALRSQIVASLDTIDDRLEAMMNDEDSADETKTPRKDVIDTKDELLKEKEFRTENFASAALRHAKAMTNIS